MKTFTLKIPDALEAKIRRTMAQQKETFSELARRALTPDFESCRSLRNEPLNLILPK